MDQIQSLEWRCQEPLNLQGTIGIYFSSTSNDYSHKEYPVVGRYRYVRSRHYTKIIIYGGNAPTYHLLSILTTVFVDISYSKDVCKAETLYIYRLAYMNFMKKLR